ncbi:MULTISPECIES: FMN-dependent NADH-azoreductase [Carnobacterium]|uniref:FMN-dependent NADH-azoreductase n=1 Tax=Carnobacterium TaxID=2747 RepID=UPI000C762772|nr:NAD(P)H-dependent oxidoreductase [Carnobacterium maltaromaticum]PLS39255.1 FMN-dependent NADH-azoreductase [Carnobacterium maltaromaticum]PLS40064.1 FMN-dependent NADH-azoreductase [Carnobacterium maltaromaticum]PLS40401.1 FMN-dependent NADH-azoreductase [Carnobacterium maltaromaticum]PLS46044.1 FMN-dependent NADH-azoreductase [Carnobacterium maltaromaticum]PLS47196.1 FMN-dependent NADH-azoreductase [Carnobacterium maltaromaticum]
MSKVLVIKAHPLTGEVSRSMQVVDTFITAYKEKNHFDHINEINLYTSFIPEIDLDILAAWDALRTGTEFETLSQEQQDKVSRFNELTELFLDADKVIIANPLWNLNVPTRLKAWIDTVNVAGKTFKYTAEGPVGLVTDKKVLHIQSSGGVYKGQDPASQYLKMIFNFIGVTDYHQLAVEGMDHDPEHAPAIMAEGFAAAKELAQTF